VDSLPFAGEDSLIEGDSALSYTTAVMDEKMTPSGSSRVRSVTQRGRFKRPAKSHGITHGYVPGDVAERIFRDALAEWGISSSNEGVREEILGGMAEVLWASTSSETDWSTVYFELEGELLCMQPFINVCVRSIGHDNPLRVWLRSFRHAEMALRIHDFLDTPENLAQRQEAAGSYGAEIRDARFCFDMADALLITGREFTATDRNIINSLKIYATSRAQSNANARGLSQPMHDTSGGKAGGGRADGGGQLPGLNAAPPSIRSGFTPVR